ncbi:hypothetical protein CDL15_Pgr004577 [Punica granatum]|uniref:Uncharacterized protein n=1 Tax=Punica granatum TaxID=22663 RepID=A0A218WR24_PUNGR|nr:hypothetical protein CDL15_Pgr004577 [Punica granatum]
MAQDLLPSYLSDSPEELSPGSTRATPVIRAAMAQMMGTKVDSATRLAEELFSRHKDRNTVFSPLSVQVVLGMVVAGLAGPDRRACCNSFELTPQPPSEGSLQRWWSMSVRMPATPLGPSIQWPMELGLSDP